jgi:hypothetical protein
VVHALEAALWAFEKQDWIRQEWLQKPAKRDMAEELARRPGGLSGARRAAGPRIMATFGY